MKKKFLNWSMNLIQSKKNCTKDEINIIAYGLEGIYLTFTKLVIILLLSILLGILKEVILLLVFFNVIRNQAFGIHASKSIYCLIASTFLFVGGAMICKLVTFNLEFMIIVSILCNICLFLYAPADTYKRPLVNETKRQIYKFKSTILGIIFSVCIILFRDYSFVNFLFVGMIEAVLMILPFTYMIFHLPYNNYKLYLSGV